MHSGEWKKQIGQAIQATRLLSNLTQDELAARLRKKGFNRCSRCLLSKIESGVSVIRGYELYYIRQVVGSKFEKLFWSPINKSRKGSQCEP